ncbi:hypothetical protein BDR04DRAFT_1121895 [Suillus decipiens]|nr:hypothetical protein BDR04DRAFT_1121895 [Suillus decipiens]
MSKKQTSTLLEGIQDTFDTLGKISSRMYTSGSHNHNRCQDYVGAVLQDIDEQGWNLIRPEFLEQLSQACTLLKDAEELSTLVANFQDLCTTYLKAECLHVLCTSHLWIAAKEEILCLTDQDPQALDDALFNERLVWQVTLSYTSWPSFSKDDIKID